MHRLRIARPYISAVFHRQLPSSETLIGIHTSKIGPQFSRDMSSAVAKRLEGKTILITGASSGIGRSTAFEFARTSPKNLKLVLTARRIDVLKQVAQDIVKEVGDGVKVLTVQLDVSKEAEIKKFVAELPEEFKQIDVLVNNA
jgi:3-hydroxy acid dehydrogenase/malonic semialdehyde reductase